MSPLFSVPVTHPGFTFAVPQQLGPTQAHILGFAKRIHLGMPPKPKVELSPSVQRLEWLVAQCKARKIALSIDIESLPPSYDRPELAKIAKFAKLRAFGFGADIGPGIGMSWFFPCHPSIWAGFKKAMADRKLIKVFCNGISYDIPVLKRYGVEVRGPVHDIRDGRRALSSTSRVALAHQASLYLTVPPWKAEASEDDSDAKGYVDATRIKKKRLLTYNAKDCVFTAQVRTKHVQEFRHDPDPERLKRLYKQQLRLADAASWMQYAGFPVDRKRFTSIAKELRDVARERDLVLAKLVRPYAKVKMLAPGEKGDKFKGMFRISYTGGVNERDLASLIYHEAERPGIRSFGLEVPLSPHCRTETGAISVDRNALLFMFVQTNCPEELRAIIRAAWRADGPRKALSTYVLSEKVTGAIGPDNRVHAQHNSCGTETGRFSCSNPNLYNLSEAKEDDPILGDLPNIRDVYVAPPGMVIVHRDYKQLELEVMADYTGDVLLRKMLATGDAHTARVHEWFNVPVGEAVPKMLRKQGKVVGFCSQYGGGADMVFLQVLAQMPDAQYEDVAELHALFPEKHVQIREHWERSLMFAEAHGYNEEPVTNRRRYYPPGMSIRPTDTSNYAIQGGAAGIANSAMVGWDEAEAPSALIYRLRKEHPTAWLAMHTYDSFDVICKEKDAIQIDKLMDECMSTPRKVGEIARPFLSDGKIGHRWSEV